MKLKTILYKCCKLLYLSVREVNDLIELNNKWSFIELYDQTSWLPIPR